MRRSWQLLHEGMMRILKDYVMHIHTHIYQPSKLQLHVISCQGINLVDWLL
jgi:hypothetical protein